MGASDWLRAIKMRCMETCNPLAQPARPRRDSWVLQEFDFISVSDTVMSTWVCMITLFLYLYLFKWISLGPKVVPVSASEVLRLNLVPAENLRGRRN